MKIYFTASFSAERRFLRLYKKILSIIKLQPILDVGLKPEEIFVRAKKGIEEADVVVVEVSEPSMGVGSEIAYALTLDKPVLALFYKESQNKLSPMIAGNPSDSLFLEHYDNDNLRSIIKNFLKYVDKAKKRKGKLIVIEGSDGSGKTTQTKMLVDYLKKNHKKVREIEFPRYYTSFHGEIVARFQRGEFGTINSVSPYLISLAYALDRLSARDEINDWLQKGHFVIANRYVPSSIAHQAAKVPTLGRNNFIDWLDQLEYRVHKMPKEDLVIYLYVPWQTGQKLAHQKSKAYLNGGKDISEENKKHLEESEKMYKYLSTHKKNWVTINCTENGKIKSKEEIQEEIRKYI